MHAVYIVDCPLNNQTEGEGFSSLSADCPGLVKALSCSCYSQLIYLHVLTAAAAKLKHVALVLGPGGCAARCSGDAS